MSFTFAFSSPLTLLRRWSETGEQLLEALILGYTVDLPFLERYLVVEARALGARVTVLSDAHQATHDDVDVRLAGRIYLHAYAVCAGAFHPKLTLLVGQSQVWVAIGSGNPTMSGWGHNSELLLVVRGSRERGPRLFADLAEWLVALPTVVQMPKWAGTVLAEISDQIIPEALNETLSDVALVHNLATPIIDQIDSGPVEELSLCAPFFDPASIAVKRLIGRFKPAGISLGVQPKLSSYDGVSLANALASVPSHDLRFIDEDRISHGKLIEWSSPGTRRVLVGSPNLSVAALLRTTSDDANCELAVMGPAMESLLPAGAAASTVELSKHQTIADSPIDDHRTSLVVLGVRRSKQTLEVDLVAPAARVGIEGASDSGPGEWTELTWIDVEEQGPVHASFAVEPTPGAGYAVRARVMLGSESFVSRVAFVNDLTKCSPRTAIETGPELSQDFDPHQFFTDEGAADRFRKDFNHLLAASAAATKSGAIKTQNRESTHSSGAEEDRWSSWLNQVQNTLKPTLTGLLFANSAETVLQIGAPTWSVDVDDGVDITDDEDEEAVDPLTEQQGGDERIAPTIASSAREVWRKWDRKLLKRLESASSPLPLEIRLIAFRLHLDLLAAGLWGPGDETWANELMRFMEVLVAEDGHEEDVPGPAGRTVAALLANGFALLFSELKQAGGTEIDLHAQQLWHELAPSVAPANEEDVFGQVLQPGSSYGRVAAATAVHRLVSRAKAGIEDPTTELRAILRADGFDVLYHDGAWVADIGDKKGRRYAAARIAQVVGRPCVVLVSSDTYRCAVAWVGDDLIYVDGQSKVWKRFRVSAVGGPVTTIAGQDGISGAKQTSPLLLPGRGMTRICEAAGVQWTKISAFIT